MIVKESKQLGSFRRGINLYVPKKNITLGPNEPNVTDPDALAYVINVQNIDNQSLEESTKIAINNFVIGCKNDGSWDSIKSCCILAGARTLNGALIPLKGTAPTQYNFTSSDYNRATGLKGDGSTKYLNSNRADNSDPQNNQHIACYHTDPTAYNGNFQFLMGSFSFSTSIASAIFISSTSTQSLQSRRSDTVQNSLLVGDELIKFKGVSRGSSSNFQYYFAPGHSGLSTSASSTPGNQNILVFARGNFAGVPSFFSSARISFYSIGENLNLGLFHFRVNTLMSALSTLS